MKLQNKVIIFECLYILSFFIINSYLYVFAAVLDVLNFSNYFIYNSRSLAKEYMLIYYGFNFIYWNCIVFISFKDSLLKDFFAHLPKSLNNMIGCMCIVVLFNILWGLHV